MPFQLLSWRNASKRHVGALMIVSPEPVGSGVFDLLYGSKQVLSEPLVADGAIVALDVRILLGLAGLDMLDGN